MDSVPSAALSLGSSVFLLIDPASRYSAWRIGYVDQPSEVTAGAVQGEAVHFPNPVVLLAKMLMRVCLGVFGRAYQRWGTPKSPQKYGIW